jgi:hypothetical protein
VCRVSRSIYIFILIVCGDVMVHGVEWWMIMDDLFVLDSDIINGTMMLPPTHAHPRNFTEESPGLALSLPCPPQHPQSLCLATASASILSVVLWVRRLEVLDLGG